MKEFTLEPNSAATTEEFEFSALREARYYPLAIVREFMPYLSGHVLEVGAGIGQMSKLFVEAVGGNNFTAVEPDAKFAKQFREECPGIRLVEGTVSNLPGGTSCSTIVSVNVIEHIEDHVEELARYHALLSPKKGNLCILAPARPEIYSPLDKDFGHFRRYTRRTMKEALTEAGFAPEKIFYFNFPGYFAWLLNFKLMQSRSFNPTMVRFYDRFIFRYAHCLESEWCRPCIGQSIVAIARAR
ncbi:MAG: class I SAM-dependent methyltransferase [bacterium]